MSTLGLTWPLKICGSFTIWQLPPNYLPALVSRPEKDRLSRGNVGKTTVARPQCSRAQCTAALCEVPQEN